MKNKNSRFKTGTASLQPPGRGKFEKQTVLKFLAACKAGGLARNGKKILIAVSGGSDSAAMAALASKLKNKTAVAYIDHKLRSDSKNEKEFVRKLASRFKMPFYTKSFDVARTARVSGKSVEDCARDARYRLLAGICKKHGMDTIFTGHTLNDNTETFFLKLLRGGGISSFYGIARQTSIFGVPVGRPLLDFERDELKKYLAAVHLPFMTDKSNKNRKFLRNKIRLDLIPFLEKLFGKSALKHISALRGQAEDLEKLVYETATELRKKAAKGKLDNSVYLSYNKFLRKCFLSEFVGKQANSRYIDKIDRFISSGKGGAFKLKNTDLTIKKGVMYKRRKNETS
ncbi:MAG: tRNA lysidine(34) synthetase TilS [Elusimicrobiota bacterium]|nr:tRNA lysidine(34) synthetase TilS [Elusimicrobiota bacterium]